MGSLGTGVVCATELPHSRGRRVGNLALEGPSRLLVDRTDLPGNCKDPMLGQLTHFSVPWFSPLENGDESNSSYFWWL